MQKKLSSFFENLKKWKKGGREEIERKGEKEMKGRERDEKERKRLGGVRNHH